MLSFLLSVVYVFVAEYIASSAANGLASRDWRELVLRSIFLFLLLVGFWAMGYAFQRQRTPMKSMGLIRRKTALREFGLGAAFGWGAMVACVLPIAVFGGITLTFWSSPRQLGLLGIDLLALLIARWLKKSPSAATPFSG